MGAKDEDCDVRDNNRVNYRSDANCTLKVDRHADSRHDHFRGNNWINPTPVLFTVRAARRGRLRRVLVGWFRNSISTSHDVRIQHIARVIAGCPEVMNETVAATTSTMNFSSTSVFSAPRTSPPDVNVNECCAGAGERGVCDGRREHHGVRIVDDGAHDLENLVAVNIDQRTHLADSVLRHSSWRCAFVVSTSQHAHATLAKGVAQFVSSPSQTASACS